MWKTRTRNKITIGILVYIGVTIWIILYGWVVNGRQGADEILKALFSSGMWTGIVNAVTIGVEKTFGKKE